MTRPLETAWANHSEKLHGPPYEREAATPQSLTETCKIHSQITYKVQTKAVGSAEERFVQAVRLASCDLNMKTGGGQAASMGSASMGSWALEKLVVSAADGV